ncbi:MAG TPA: hypothetical protein PL182_10400 [Pseudobdellovibrionaceae bacterium]|nr:hypothetical protein [Pseudobdellovibrionaceae bacterium]
MRFKATTVFGFFLLSVCLSACSLDASISSLKKSVRPVPHTSQSRKNPDFTSGQTVLTSEGFRVRAVFGEIPEKQISGGHEITVVIHE